MPSEFEHDTKNGRALGEIVGPAFLHDIPDMVGNDVPFWPAGPCTFHNLQHNGSIMQNSIVERWESRVELQYHVRPG